MSKSMVAGFKNFKIVSYYSVPSPLVNLHVREGKERRVRQIKRMGEAETSEEDFAKACVES